MGLEDEIKMLKASIRKALHNGDTDQALSTLEELNAASEESDEPTVYDLTHF